MTTINGQCVVPEKNPYPPHGRSLKIPTGGGVLKAKILEAKYEAKLEFLGGREGAKQKPSMGGGSMDIFWNYTIQTNTGFISPVQLAKSKRSMKYFHLVAGTCPTNSSQKGTNLVPRTSCLMGDDLNIPLITASSYGKAKITLQVSKCKFDKHFAVPLTGEINRVNNFVCIEL